MKTLVLATAALLGSLATSAADAAATIRFVEANGMIDISLSGSLDLTGMVSDGQVYGSLAGAVQPQIGTVQIGGSFMSPTYEYVGVTGPASFGTNWISLFTSNSGDALYLFNLSHALYITTSYVSGAQLSAAAQIANATFASIGINPGDYVYTLASGDTLTIAVSAVPEPGTAALGVMGVAFLMLAASRRRSSH